MSFIFISYSRQDQDYVGLLAQTIESHHLPFWLDINTDYGDTWPHTIEKQVECCQVLIIVMSPRSKQSHWVQYELAHALELRKPIFPLLLEGNRWFSVAALQTVDVTGGKLPPARFFDTLRPYFPAPAPTAKSLPLQDVIEESIPTESSFTTPADSVMISTAVNTPFTEYVEQVSRGNRVTPAEVRMEEKSNDQQRLLSKIRESIQLVVAEGEDICGTFSVLGEESKWVQFKENFINVSYPFDVYPSFGYLLDQSNRNLSSKLESWESGSYALFEFPDFDKSDLHQAELASWIYSYFTDILECPDVFDFDFELF